MTAIPLPQIDRSPIRAHVEMLHQLAAGIDGVLAVSAYNALSDKGGTVTHHRISDVDDMAEAIEAHLQTPHVNVYTGLQVMRRSVGRGKRGKEADIVAVLGLVVDLDADTGRAGEMPVEPNYVLETSPGNYQPFIIFDRPLPPAEAKPIAAALKRATDADHGTADVTHVWRIPGTQNWPNQKKLSRGRSPDPVEVTVAQPWDGALTSVDELRTALAPWWSAPAAERQVELGELPAVDGVQVSTDLAAMLAADDVGDRSAHAARVVEKFAFDGHSADVACALFLAATGDWFARYEGKDARADFVRLWGKYGQPHAEQREATKEMIAGLVSKKTTPKAANDNQPDAEPARKLPSLPDMHPTPFTPEAAGGLLADISRWITETAIIPVPELSLCSAIALIGGMFGDRALGPTRSGLNMFLTTVMGVASGKGHAPKSIIQLATVAGKPGAVTNGDPTSYAAIERMLRRNSSTVIVMDEFGVTLQDVNNRRANAASASIRKFLLSIYDQADSFFHGRQYASDETKKDDSPLKGPALTVLGMTTPSTLYAGLSDDSLSDGFLSRFVFMEGRGPEIISPPRLDRDAKLPKGLKADLERALKSFPAASNPLGINKVTIPFDGHEEGEAYTLWADIFRWQNDPAWSDREHHVNGRAAENTIRLATIRAVSRNPASPAINAEDVAWGWAIVHRSIAIVTEGVDRHMAGSTVEALRKAIVRALEVAKDRTLPWSFLLQREVVSTFKQDDVSDALAWLIETGKVVDLSGRSKPGARASFKLVAG
ncbi:MAG: DUF3987 domain-containing protein [Mesorhizobium sp.]